MNKMYKTSTRTDKFICSLLIHYVSRNALTNNAFTMCKYQELSSKLFRDKLNMCFIRLSFNKFQLENDVRKCYPQHSFCTFFSYTIQKTQISAGKTCLDKNVFINRLLQKRYTINKQRTIVLTYSCDDLLHCYLVFHPRSLSTTK